MPEAATPRTLAAHELGPAMDPRQFGFNTTDELSPLDELVGQPRALRALRVGMGVRQPGFHVYVAGVSGTGRMEMIRRTLHERARQEAAPNDWVFVNNFDKPDEPIALSLPAGQGWPLQQEMANLVARLLDELPKAFQREDFSREKERLRADYRKRGEAVFNELNQMARERQVAVQQLPDGQIVFVPLREGRPITSEELEKLTPVEIQQLERHQQELVDATQTVVQRQQEIERQLNADVRQVERAFADRLVAPLLGEIANRFSGERLRTWLDRLKAHFLLNLDRFRRRADRLVQQFEPLLGEPILADVQERFYEYQVNLLVDRRNLGQAPVVIEAAPTYRNLFGTIERVVDRYGRVVTNFTRIKAGSLLQANGGYLVFDILDALAEPFVWKELKRALKRGSEEIEIYDPFALFTISGLKPEPIPLNIKLIVVGSPLMYHLLYLYDEEFREFFKLKADFDTEIATELEPGTLYGRLVRKLTETEKTAPFDAAGTAELVRASARLAGHREKITAEFSRVCDIIREATYWARQAGAACVSTEHVRHALAEQVYRSDLIASKIRELVRDGTLLVDVRGSAVGQVNGLAVADLGDYAFAWPARVTASVGVGSGGIVNIERESRLSGRTFDKGMLIVEGYLRNQYAGEWPLGLSASLAMEQSYGGVDGDSASVAELLSLLSALARAPLRQDVAVTGSIDQWGRVQAIGAVNEKIEGFFDACREVGLTGTQGVCVPEANVKNLVLRHDVVESVSEGRFRVWPIDHIDRGMELLSGMAAGSAAEAASFHGRVAQRLREMNARLPEQRAATVERGFAAPSQPPSPPDPRPPLPGLP